MQGPHYLHVRTYCAPRRHGKTSEVDYSAADLSNSFESAQTAITVLNRSQDIARIVAKAPKSDAGEGFSRPVRRRRNTVGLRRVRRTTHESARSFEDATFWEAIGVKTRRSALDPGATL